jgi:hypothetical protein
VVSKFRPRQFDELAGDPTPITLINEPLPPDNVATLVPKARSLHAVLVESMTNTKALASDPLVAVPKQTKKN